MPDANPTALLSRPTDEQRKWLEMGITEPGGKLPCSNPQGERIPDLVIDACLRLGWAEQWIYNPLKPNMKVCRLTQAGRLAATREQVVRVDFSRWKRDSSEEAVA